MIKRYMVFVGSDGMSVYNGFDTFVGSFTELAEALEHAESLREKSWQDWWQIVDHEAAKACEGPPRRGGDLYWFDVKEEGK